MSHKPIFIQNLSFFLQHKTCFADFNTTVYSGSKIGIIGDNGGGKSTLLRMIQGLVEATSGRVIVEPEVVFGYVPQLPLEDGQLSGGQQFNASLSQALALQPDVLCLDEPTNHLDRQNRRSLMRMMQHFQGTLLVVSHDVELLRSCVDTLWAVQDGEIIVFDGSYDAFIEDCRVRQAQLQQRIKSLDSQKMHVRKELRVQQERSARRARANKNENDRKLLGFLKGSADASLGKHQEMVGKISEKIANERSLLQEPEKITVSFELLASTLANVRGNVIEVSGGVVGYDGQLAVVDQINLTIANGERIALVGDNGSGKSTLVKAFLGVSEVVVSGAWHLPKPPRIGYLDQHYKTLSKQLTVLENVQAISHLPHSALRKILNDFLFRKNEEVGALVSQLSGGEKARLALACIALQEPQLLLLDEITNNLDLQTREHVIQVLNQFPGAIVVISHDEDFLRQVSITSRYVIKDGRVGRKIDAF